MGSLVLHCRVTQQQRFLLLVYYLYLQTRVHHGFSNIDGPLNMDYGRYDGRIETLLVPAHLTWTANGKYQVNVLQ